MKFHPFNLRRRITAHIYRKKNYQSVLDRTNAFLKNKPDDLFMLELRARAFTSQRNWGKGFEFYQRVFEINPFYCDSASQFARCAIYIKNWNALNVIAKEHPEALMIESIQSALEKKMDSVTQNEFIDLMEHDELVDCFPQRCLELWANLEFAHRPSALLQIDQQCMEKRIGGSYLGYVVLILLRRSKAESRKALDNFIRYHSITEMINWISPALEQFPEEMEVVGEWIISYLNPRKISLDTLEALCVTEYLPKSVDTIIREFISHVSEESLSEAIRVIGRKTDLRAYITEDLLEEMITKGIRVKETPSIHTWMIEHCLRTKKDELIRQMLISNSLGISSSLINAMRNLTNNRSDKRLTQLLEIIYEHEYLLEETAMRHEIAKAIAPIADPILAMMFTYQCIQMEPQDAPIGLLLLNSAIKTGSPDLILQTSDIVLSMKHRSSKIDYASIAIAAVRMGNINHAKTLLKENRLGADTRSQRIRIGIPFHMEKDYQTTLDEADNTESKHSNDPAIKIYQALSLMHLESYNDALMLANKEIKDETEKSLIKHMVHRKAKQFSQANHELNMLMEKHGRQTLPSAFFDSNYDYLALDNANPIPRQSKVEDTKLVSVIMTVHRWNDAFPLAVHSILAQNYRNLELIIVDDASSKKDVLRYDKLLTDERIVRVQMKKNLGTYACRNEGIQRAKGEYITFADSDDWNHPDRIKDSVNIIEEQGKDLAMGRFIRVSPKGELQFNGSKISQFCLVGIMIRKSILDQYQLMFDQRARYSADSEFFERVSRILGDGQIFKHSKIDVIALHHEKSLTGGGKNAIDWMGPGESRLRYVASYRKAHQKIRTGENLSIREFNPPNDEILSQNPNDTESRLRDIFGLREDKNEKSSSVKSRDEKISVFMATYPGGFATVSKSVETILNQSAAIDSLVLHVNGIEMPPELPEDERLTVHLSKENHADNGKFKYLTGVKGYVLTVDDDICYPRDYVERMVDHVEHFNREAMIGVHGAVFPVGPPLSRWNEYKELRRTHVFGAQSATFTQVNCLGTGTMAFHTDAGIPNFMEMNSLRMVDLHVAVWAQENQIPMYSCPREKDWLTEFEIVQSTRIWAQANSQQDLQWQMIEALNRTKEWSPLAQFRYHLVNGPIKLISGWKNRQIPKNMHLPEQLTWKPISEKPKVTIYVPAFNAAKYIIECVDSALAQSYENFEVSIQNGGEDDDTLELLENHYKDNKKVMISSKPTSLGEGTNIAIAQSNGELILQLDSDDILQPDALEKLVLAIGTTNLCAYGNLIRIDTDGNYIDDGWEEAIYSRERLMRSMIVHHPRLFRRDAWELVNRHDEELKNAEDYDFFLKLSEIGNFVHLRENLYKYRVVEGSASNQSYELLTNNTHLVQNRMLERNNFDYELVVDNPDYPRNVRYRHIAFCKN